VHSGISTEFWNIVLAQESYAREDYESSGIQKFFISPRKNLAAFSQQIENIFFVKIFNPGTLEMNQVFAADDYTFTNDDKENIEWSPEAHRLIIPAVSNKEGQKNYFIVTIDTLETLSIKELTGDSNLSHVRWDPKNKDVLFYMSDDKLYRLDLNDLTGKKIVAEHIASYDLSQKALFYFQLPEGIVYKTSYDGADTPTQITTSGPEDMSDSSYQIIVYDDDRVVFLNKSNELYIYNRGEVDTYFNKLSNNATGSQFSDDGKKLLFWNNNEISAYFVRKWEVQPVRAENESMSITKFSDTISNVQWTRDYEHVIFTNNNKIKLIEIDNRDHRNMMDVLSLNDNSSLLVNNFTDGKLYYTEKNDQGQNSLHAIYFPERTTFFQSFFPAGTNTAVQN
jgi:dipeptidyl aminopeptidase/acylaminoacyl peptidase